MTKKMHLDYNIYSYHNSARNPTGEPKLWAVRCAGKDGAIHSIHKDREKAMDVAVKLCLDPSYFETKAFKEMTSQRGTNHNKSN